MIRRSAEFRQPEFSNFPGPCEKEKDFMPLPDVGLLPPLLRYACALMI